MTTTVLPLGKKFFRLGASSYTNKKGTMVHSFGLEEVKAIPDGSGGITYEGAFQGTRLLCASPDEFRAFLEQVARAMPSTKANGKVRLDDVPLRA